MQTESQYDIAKSKYILVMLITKYGIVGSGQVRKVRNFCPSSNFMAVAWQHSKIHHRRSFSTTLIHPYSNSGSTMKMVFIFRITYLMWPTIHLK